MLEAVELVAKAAAERDIVPILRFVCVQDGRAQAGDSRVCVDVPLAEASLQGLCIEADKLLHGMRAAKGKPVLRTKEGRLEIRRPSGGWTDAKTREPLEYSLVPPPAGAALGRVAMEPLKRIKGFISENAIHAWSVGVLLREGYAYATNGISFVARTPVEYTGPDVCLPVYCLDKILSLPFSGYDAVDGGDRGLYLVNGDVWVRTTAITLPWPDIAKMFADFPAELPALPAAQLKEALEVVVPSIADTKDMRVTIRDGVLVVQADEAGEPVALPNGAWRAEILELLVRHATHADLSLWPRMCPWQGSGMQGFAMGVKA
jgi:hypothetical protein